MSIGPKPDKNRVATPENRTSQADHSPAPRHPIQRLKAFLRRLLQDDREASVRRESELASHLAAREWQATFDAVNDAIWLLDKDFRILRCNKATKSILGKAPEEIVGRHCWEIVHGTQVPLEECPAPRMAKSLQRETITLEMAGRSYQVAVDPILDEQGRLTGIVHTLSDVTSRKLAERETTAWRQRYELVAAAAHMAVYDCCSETGEIHWGGGITPMLGYTPEQMGGGFQQWVDLIHPEDRTRVLELLAEAERNLATFDAEYRFRHQDGHYVLLHDRGYPLYHEGVFARRFVGVMEDVTENRKIDWALRASESRFRALVENTPTGVWQDDAERRTVYVNPAMCAMLEVDSPEEVLERDWRCFFTEESIRTIDREHARRLEGIASSYEVELVGRRGTHRNLVVFGTPFLSPEGRPQGTIASLLDITDRKRADREREALEIQLRQSQKMEAVGRLAGGIAHDFNNLLMVIQNYTDLARQTLPFSSPAWEALERVTDAAQQAAGVTRALLTFSRRVPFEKQPLDLRKVVRDAVRMIERTLPNSIQVVTDLPAGEPLGVMGEATQLCQVIINLTINAWDAMPTGGTLRIKAAPSPPRPGQPPTVQLTVSDSGMGMSPEIVEHAFEPFFSTKPMEKGTGLGLPIVHGIIKDHGGSIAVDSEPGKGTSFMIIIPLYEGEIMPRPPAPPIPTPQGAGQLILLAEDHEQVQAIIRTALQTSRFEVTCAPDGEAMMAIFRRHRDRVAVIVADIDLPKRSGLSCLREIRESGSTVPAILITAAADAEIESALDENTVLVCKPFAVTQLAELVTQLLARAGQEKTLP